MMTLFLSHVHKKTFLASITNRTILNQHSLKLSSLIATTNYSTLALPLSVLFGHALAYRSGALVAPHSEVHKTPAT